MKTRFSAMVIIISSLSGCASVQDHKQAVANTDGDRITVGTVQKEIRVGMSSADVALALGSPNIVNTDQERREVWIYDKFSTETAYSTSSGGVNALILGLGAVIGAGGGGYNASSGANSQSQKTLTIVIKFDNNSLVRDFAYHTSRF